MSSTTTEKSNFYNGSARLGRLAVTLIAACQLSLPVAISISAAALLPAESALAEESASVTLLQGFGYDPTNAGYKALIQFKNGSQHFVWYPELIGAKVGSVVKLTYEGSGTSMYFHKLINLGNGRESTVLRHLKVN